MYPSQRRMYPVQLKNCISFKIVTVNLGEGRRAKGILELRAQWYI